MTLYETAAFRLHHPLDALPTSVILSNLSLWCRPGSIAVPCVKNCFYTGQPPWYLFTRKYGTQWNYSICWKVQISCGFRPSWEMHMCFIRLPSNKKWGKGQPNRKSTAWHHDATPLGFCNKDEFSSFRDSLVLGKSLNSYYRIDGQSCCFRTGGSRKSQVSRLSCMWAVVKEYTALLSMHNYKQHSYGAKWGIWVNGLESISSLKQTWG